MGLTIFKTLRTDAFPKTPEGKKQIRLIIKKHTSQTTVDPNTRQVTHHIDEQAIYDEIDALGLWKEPSEESKETVLDWYHNAGVVTLENGIGAGIVIYQNDDDITINIFAI